MVIRRGTVVFGFEQANKYTVLDQDGNTVLKPFANPASPVFTAFRTVKPRVSLLNPKSPRRAHLEIWSEAMCM